MSKYTIFFLLFIITVGCSKKDSPEEMNKTKNKAEDKAVTLDSPSMTLPDFYDRNLVLNYKIIKENDISIKAINSNLSSYSISDIQNLPLNIRKEYRIILPMNISKEQAMSTIIQLVLDKTKENLDIDAIVVFAYERESQINGVYTLAKLEWCPNGNWGGVDSYIASTNDRTDYKFVFDLRDKLGQSRKINRPTEKEFEIYEYVEKELWKDVTTDEEIILKRVANKYGLSVNELREICIKVVTYNQQ